MNSIPQTCEDRPEIDGEKAYPIYFVSFKFLQLLGDRKVEEWHRLVTEPGEPTRFHNASSWYVMTKEKLAGVGLEQQIALIMRSFNENYPDAKVLESTIKLVYWETWVIQWFSHATYDDGRTDAEFERSFSRYVNRHQVYQRDFLQISRNELDVQRFGVQYPVCLMGAEDRWRWRSNNEDQEKIVCRCDGCKKWGVVRIVH